MRRTRGDIRRRLFFEAAARDVFAFEADFALEDFADFDDADFDLDAFAGVLALA